MIYMCYQLDDKEPPDKQIQAILARHIQKYGPPPFIVEVNPSVAPQLTPCQDVQYVSFPYIQEMLTLVEVKKEQEEIA